MTPIIWHYPAASPVYAVCGRDMLRVNVKREKLTMDWTMVTCPGCKRPGSLSTGLQAIEEPRVRPRRKHSKDGAIYCPLCAPLRCSKAK